MARTSNRFPIYMSWDVRNQLGVYLFMKDTDCPDGESLQSLLIYEINCVLSERCQLTNSCWPILVAALLRNWSLISYHFTAQGSNPDSTFSVNTT